jgi:hypothetical protein
MEVRTHVSAVNDANRLGLLYQSEAARLPWRGPIWDVHVHLRGNEAARQFFRIADWFGVQRIWTMTPLREVDALQREFGDRLRFIAVPDYARREHPTTFSSQWLADIEAFADRGCRVCKFWSAPRGRDLSPHLLLDAPIRIEAMKLCRTLGIKTFMVHVADPDTWFATHYRDARRYGSKAQQYDALHRVLEMFPEVTWIAAHMGGDPEHLDHLQMLLDRYPHLVLDCSATKWMVRELSKNPGELRGFLTRNAGRVLFGSDIVAGPGLADDDLYASRWWALRTLLETDYDGPSPIVDPDLPLVDPTLPREATVTLRGVKLDPATLHQMYHLAPRRVLGEA